jgi:hypothetical protein
VHAIADRDINEASADVMVTASDGNRYRLFVEHAVGSLERPMTDDGLARKFHDLVDPILGGARADELIASAMTITSAPDVRSLTDRARDAHAPSILANPAGRR